MTPFLHEIARYFIERQGRDLIDFCFVFPNKRAGVFFNHYLGLEADKAGFPLIHPEVLTISDFVADITDSVEASRIEQLFLLYRCYRDIMSRHAASDDDTPSVDFNKFQYWGDVIINDFTDVDKYMVDSSELFHNIESLREISANYLTPEQIEVIKRYWGEDKLPRQAAEFWNHAVHVSDKGVHGEHRTVASFVKLWQVMDQLYHEFNDLLQSRGLAYQGMMYRRALEIIRNTPADEFPFTQYVFIGFNVLSTIEEKIFETLKSKGMAMFFWDYASPVFNRADGNRANRFLKKYVREFSQPADAADVGGAITSWPRIDIIGVPSVNGQAKIVADIVGRLMRDDEEAGGDSRSMDKLLLSTAIILPDEGMCLPVLNTMSTGIKDINVTMGYPLRDTAVASLVSKIVSMQLRARETDFENSFFKEDVVDVLSHPIVRAIDSAVCDEIVKEINLKRLINVPLSLLASMRYEPLHPLFRLARNSGPNREASGREVFSFLKELIQWLLDFVRHKYSVPDITDSESAGIVEEDRLNRPDLTSAGAIEAGFLMHYLEAIDELQRLQRCHLEDLNVDLNDSTVFRMVERLVAGSSVSFEGRPLKGLQIMGLLETRALDFDNIIVTSMNERIFPRKHFAASFIPPALRYGYGMATMEYQESISAYYFYRLISRAKRVFLLYDTRSQGASSGEPSRYISQLRYLYNPPSMNVWSAGYKLLVQENKDVEITLDEDRLRLLHRYVDEKNPRFISATSINNFIDCPVEFTLSYIEGYYDRNDTKDFFDEATFGSVLHQVVERLYKSLQTDGRPVVINRAVIQKLRQDSLIGREIHKAINTHYLNRPENDTTQLAGESELIAKMMLEMVRNMLDHELDEYDEFTFISGEQKQNVRLRISDRLTVNLSYTIDRVDSVVNGDGRRVVRIIDYKTGGDSLDTTVDRMFVPYKYRFDCKRDKAILQLFLYCNAFEQNQVNAPLLADKPLIQPMIYQFKSIGRNLPPSPVTIDKVTVCDYRQFNGEIMERLDQILYPLFNHTVEEHYRMRPPEDDHACIFCKFKTICQREES